MVLDRIGGVLLSNPKEQKDQAIQNQANPRVSVIIPTFNRASLLGEAIESVLDQSFENREVIVIDDGSTDDTDAVLGRFRDQIISIRQPNAGVCAARNRGFAASSGELVSFLDSDDRLMPGNLQTLVRMIDEGPGIDVACGWYYWVDRTGQRLWLDGPGDTRPILEQLVLEEKLLLGTSLIRRECVRAVAGFDETLQFQEHWNFYLKLARRGYTFARCSEPVALLRLHDDNRGQDHQAMLASRVRVLEELFADAELPESIRHIEDQAYFNAYTEFALEHYSSGELDEGARCLAEALRHAPLRVDEVPQLVARRALDPDIDAPLEFARTLLSPMRKTPQVRRLRRKVLSRVNVALAARHGDEGRVAAMWWRAMAAVLHDPAGLGTRAVTRLRRLLGATFGPGRGSFRSPQCAPADAEFIESARETTSIFIGPHLDDVALSCGGTLALLSRCKAPIQLVTVFTASPDSENPLSPLARKLHSSWDLSDPNVVRRREDQDVALRLGTEPVWLDFLDAMYRDAELTQLALFQRSFPAVQDPCYAELRTRLEELIASHPGARVFAPLGLGNHRDHMVVHSAVQEIAQQNPAAEFYFYEDFPYATTAASQARLRKLQGKWIATVVDITDTASERAQLIRLYASQIKMLFHKPDSVENTVTRYAQRVGGGAQLQERFWSV